MFPAGLVRRTRHDAEEFPGFRGTLQVDVVFPNDRFGVARRGRGFADGAEFHHEHRNEGVAHHVVRKTEMLRDPRTDFLADCQLDRATSFVVIPVTGEKAGGGDAISTRTKVALIC